MKVTCSDIEAMYNKVRTVLAREPAYYVLATAIKIVCRENFDDMPPPYSMSPAYTDGEKIVFNAKAFGLGGIEFDETMMTYLLMHEVGHILYMHAKRFEELVEKKQHLIYNIAADIKIDYELQKTINVPKQIRDAIDKFRREYGIDPETMATEEIYHILLKKAESKRLPRPMGIDIVAGKRAVAIGKKENGKKGSCGCSGGEEKEKTINEGDPDIQEYLKKKEYEKAAEELALKVDAIQKMAGSEAGTPYKSVIEKLAEKTLPWDILLRHTVMSVVRKRKQTWKKLSRKMSHHLPGYRKKGVGTIWLLIDTSGSISDEEFHRFKSAIAEVVEHGWVAKVVYWDTEASPIYEYKSRLDLKKPRGHSRYGGTTIGCALKRIVGKIKPKDILVVLTDGYIFDEEDKKTKALLKEISPILRILVTTGKEVFKDWFTLVVKIERVNGG